jgi:hypothetical protein
MSCSESLSVKFTQTTRSPKNGCINRAEGDHAAAAEVKRRGTEGCAAADGAAAGDCGRAFANF